MTKENISKEGLWKEKYNTLQKILKEYGKVAVAFSGGVDSTFLLKVAHEVLGNQVIALTTKLCSFPNREALIAKQFCETEGIAHQVIEFDEFQIAGFANNPKNRCYLCKHALFSKMLELAKAQGISCIVEGSNVDDRNDYRPGMKAIEELKIASPLRVAGLTKEEIRLLSKQLGLSTWEKPSFACLSSRFVYGEPITKEKLAMVEQAEALLMEMGLVQFRVRMHEKMARIEVLPEDIPRLAEPDAREQINECFRRLGFSYVALDLEGYRTGSMNEMLT